MMCVLCNDPARYWVIRCTGKRDHRGNMEFAAEPTCFECGPSAMALVKAEEAKENDDVAIFDFKSGAPDL